MSHLLELIHPSTLEPGKKYLRRIKVNHGDRFQQVEFADYTPCPAIIIIWNGAMRERCPRVDLYYPSISQEFQNHLPVKLVWMDTNDWI